MKKFENKKKTANEWQELKREAWRERDEYYRQFGSNPRNAELDTSDNEEWLAFWDSYDKALA